MDAQVVARDDKAEEKSIAAPLTGNEAIAHGAWEAGVKVAAAYPGTPSTEILESISRFPAEDLDANWATNEKTSLDIAMGASFAGVRALCSMKHVGLNVASDALMSMTYIGVNGGLVIAVCDDPGIHSSQNEQDTRLLGEFASVPVLEPSDAQEALEFTRIAFDISEEFDTPVIVRATTRLSHTRSQVVTGERIEPPARSFIDNPQKNVMIPGHARMSHPRVLEREQRLKAYFAASDMTRWEKRSEKLGIITAGTCYPYVMDVVPGASILKLAASFPLPDKLIADFCASVDRVIVVEELEPVIENRLKAQGLNVEGKEWLSRTGEFSPEVIREALEKADILEVAEKQQPIEVEPIIRPPLLCAGCPHTSCYMALRALDTRVAGDIGCYTLAAVEPLRSIDTTVAMGSSIGNAVGMARAGTETRPIVATIGDSTFLHSGIPPLIDAVYSNANITIFLLDNHITAMTGGQNHAATGKSLRGGDTPRVDFEEVCKAIGIKWVKKTDSYDMGSMQRTLREAIEFRGPAVVISDRPCVLDPIKIRGPELAVKKDSCTACQSCMNLGCPAITWSDETFEGRHRVKIIPEACIGCSICAQVCPTDGIRTPEELADA